jgi:hypothetical protein
MVKHFPLLSIVLALAACAKPALPLETGGFATTTSTVAAPTSTTPLSPAASADAERASLLSAVLGLEKLRPYWHFEIPANTPLLVLRNAHTEGLSPASVQTPSIRLVSSDDARKPVRIFERRQRRTIGRRPAAGGFSLPKRRRQRLGAPPFARRKL